MTMKRYNRRPQREPFHIRRRPVDISRFTIHSRVHDLGIFTYQDIARAKSERKLDCALVTALMGGMAFFNDLTRSFRAPVKVGAQWQNKPPLDFEPTYAIFDCMAYKGRNDPLDEAIVKPVRAKPEDVAGRYCLFVDDMLDTGKTAKAVLDQLRRWGAAEIQTCFLFRKDKPDQLIDPNDVGFVVPDVWLIGNGMDDHGMCRHLPYVIEDSRFDAQRWQSSSGNN